MVENIKAQKIGTDTSYSHVLRRLIQMGVYSGTFSVPFSHTFIFVIA